MGTNGQQGLPIVSGWLKKFGISDSNSVPSIGLLLRDELCDSVLNDVLKEIHKNFKIQIPTCYNESM